MRKRNLFVLVLVVLSFGLIAAGCGDDDSTSGTTVTAEDTDVSTVTDGTDTTVEDTDSEDTGDTGEPSSASDVYDACIDVISGTPAEAAGKSACEQARTAFEQCEEQASAAGGSTGDDALAICQDAADQAIQTLEAAG
jgi:hypothetical protein